MCEWPLFALNLRTLKCSPETPLRVALLSRTRRSALSESLFICGPLKADVEVPVGRAAMRLPPHVAWTDTGAHVGSALSVELTSSEAVRGHDVSGHIIVENPTVFSLREFRIHMRSYNEHYFSNYFEAVVVAAPHHPLQSGKYVVSFQYPLPDTCRTDCVHVLEVSMCVQSGYCGNLSASVPITVSRP